MRTLIILMLSLGLLGPVYAMTDDDPTDPTSDELTVGG